MIVIDEAIENPYCITLTKASDLHKRALKPNQDAISFYSKGSNFVLAVSDGVGSCAKSEIGARFAVEECIAVFQEINRGKIPFAEKDITRRIISGWIDRIEPFPINDYCATLKVVYKIDNLIKAFSLGDGIIAISSGRNNLLSPIYEGQFINVTSCLNSKTKSSDFWFENFTLEETDPFIVLCCTDGIANVLKEGDEINFLNAIDTIDNVGCLRVQLIDFIHYISNYIVDDQTMGVVKNGFKNW